MKRLIAVCLALGISSVAAAQAMNICNLRTEYPEFCARMKHLRATANVVDSQRELMVVNFPFLAALAESLRLNAKTLQTVVPSSLEEHKVALKEIEDLAREMRSFATNKDVNVLVTANSVRGKCVGCHGTGNPHSGNWNDVFGFDWNEISKECNQEGRNPYLCKSMNGLFSNYNHLLTASNAKIENFGVTSAVAGDMARILTDLKSKSFSHHLGEDDRKGLEDAAQEVASLADAKDPVAFEKAVTLGDSCVKCHSNQASIDRGTQPLSVKWFKQSL